MSKPAGTARRSAAASTTIAARPPLPPADRTDQSLGQSLGAVKSGEPAPRQFGVDGFALIFAGLERLRRDLAALDEGLDGRERLTAIPAAAPREAGQDLALGRDQQADRQR